MLQMGETTAGSSDGTAMRFESEDTGAAGPELDKPKTELETDPAGEDDDDKAEDEVEEADGVDGKAAKEQASGA